MSVNVPDKGLFITIEGRDGSGKTHGANVLVKYLKDLGIPCVHTREPGVTAFGEGARELMLRHGEMCGEAELLLLWAARVEHIDKLIMSALQAGSVVVCDRFVDSSLAYQGYGRGLFSEHRALEELFLPANPLQDHQLLFDVDPAIAADRIGERGQANRIDNESSDFLEAVGEGYDATLSGTSGSRTYIIDANKPMADVAEQLFNFADSKILPCYSVMSQRGVQS